jgi:hypothetical protein
VLAQHVNDHYVALVRRLVPHVISVRYTFTPLRSKQDAEKLGLARLQKEYWYEILARAHAASVITILRGLRWFDATLEMASSNRYLGFAAALRGLLESAADSHDSLRCFSLTVAAHAQPIRRSLKGRATGLVLGPVLEDALIHFLFARKAPKAAALPESHRAKQVKDYIAYLETKVPGVQALYSKLCELTHAAKASVDPFFTQVGETEWTVIDPGDGDLIGALLAEHGSLIQPILMHAFNPALLALRMLNEFPTGQLHTVALNSWDFSMIPAWREIQAELANPRSAG